MRKARAEWQFRRGQITNPPILYHKEIKMSTLFNISSRYADILEKIDSFAGWDPDTDADGNFIIKDLEKDDFDRKVEELFPECKKSE